MEIRNVIELSAFSKSLSKKITYLNHEERILIDIEQIAAITPSSEREDLPKKVGLASCNNDEAKEELYTCVLLKCGFSVRVIESMESVGQTKSGVKKETKGADGKVTVAFVPEITRYKVICGSNGKVGTRYNVIKIPKEEKGRVIRKTVIDNGTVGRRLTDEEFVNMYPSQCNIFKEIFKKVAIIGLDYMLILKSK